MNVGCFADKCDFFRSPPAWGAFRNDLMCFGAHRVGIGGVMVAVIQLASRSGRLSAVFCRHEWLSKAPSRWSAGMLFAIGSLRILRLARSWYRSSHRLRQQRKPRPVRR